MAKSGFFLLAASDVPTDVVTNPFITTIIGVRDPDEAAVAVADEDTDFIGTIIPDGIGAEFDTDESFMASESEDETIMGVRDPDEDFTGSSDEDDGFDGQRD